MCVPPWAVTITNEKVVKTQRAGIALCLDNKEGNKILEEEREE